MTDRKMAVDTAQCWYALGMDKEASENDRWMGLMNALNHTENALFAARDALVQAQGKAELGAKCMQPDKRGQDIAKGFMAIADYIGSKLSVCDTRKSE
jgi:hypothetical protein